MAVEIDWDQLTLSEFIALQDALRRELRARFEREVALVFTDVVGSTAYAERWGDLAGRTLLDRHLNLVQQAIDTHRGRLVDVAGDGAFCVFDDAERALAALVTLHSAVDADNQGRADFEHLRLRTGAHVGTVLIDDQRVSGDAVNLAARVMGTAGAGDIHLTQDTYERLAPEQRLRCRRMGPFRFKGHAGAHELWRAKWRDTPARPARVRVVETGEVHDLPDRARLAFGRLDVHEGRPANDVVLALPDADRTRRISRWHFELLTTKGGMELRQVSRGRTDVDGQAVNQGETCPVQVGTRVVVGRVLTLLFEGAGEAGEDTRMALD